MIFYFMKVGVVQFKASTNKDENLIKIISYIEKEYKDYPMPKNCNYFWSFGALATILLVVLIVTGVFLAMHYTPHTDMAFNSGTYYA